MKTSINNFARKFDEMIPDATPETVKAQAKEVGKNALDIGVCIYAAGVCTAKTFESSTVLALMIGKTSAKKVANYLTDWYMGTPAMTVCR